MSWLVHVSGCLSSNEWGLHRFELKQIMKPVLECSPLLDWVSPLGKAFRGTCPSSTHREPSPTLSCGAETLSLNAGRDWERQGERRWQTPPPPQKLSLAHRPGSRGGKRQKSHTPCSDSLTNYDSLLGVHDNLIKPSLPRFSHLWIRDN